MTAGRTEQALGAGLLERSDHLSTLGDRLAEASDRGGVVMVRGEAGIGKTTLLRRFCDESGVRVLWAACDALFTPRPLGPLLDIARVTDGELRARVQAGAQPHDVACELIAELETRAPTIVVLEDVHWADEATLDVVRLLARRMDALPALLVVSYRDEQLHRTHPLRLLLGELPSRGVTRLELQRLSRGAVATLAELSALDADELFERTGGNPFFVTEALEAETERVPPTVRDAVLARAARLSPEARKLLDALAVVPQRAEVWLLEALTEGALAALDECLSSGMLRTEADGVAFRHELARLAIEESLNPDVTIVLHRRALAALADPAIGPPDYARLAHHAEAAGDTDAVLHYAPAAAEHASAVGSPREAQNQYGRALRFAGGRPPEERAELLARFGTVGELTDMRQEAMDAFEEAAAIHEARGDVLKQGETLVRHAKLLACAGRAAESRRLSREALALLEQAPAGPELALAYCSMAGDAMEADEHAKAIAWGRRAIELAERVSSDEALIRALNYVGTVELKLADPAGLQKLERSLALARTLDRPASAGTAYINIACVFAEREEWAQADGYLRDGIGYCREQGLEAWVRCLEAVQAESELAQGRWDDAATTAATVLDATGPATAEPRASALQVLALVRARRGDPEVWALLDDALAIASAAGQLQLLAPAAVARAETAWLEGRPEAIAEETDTAYALAAEHGHAEHLGRLARWRWRAGLLAEPPPGVDEMAGLEIAGRWREAAARWETRGCPYDAALARADADDGGALRQALDELNGLGARAAATVVARRLRERGERVPRGPRPQTRENPAGLTARELEVLPLLAQGMRNAQIAERLVVSPKTVDHHVSAILRKLGVSTRGEAGAEAARLGILTPR